MGGRLMKYIPLINDEFKKKILDFLYEDELFNVFSIHFIENQVEDIGELYVGESNDKIDTILHMKFDGNSYFTNFFTKNEIGYTEIAKQLQILNYNRVLLAGKRKEVSKVLSCLGKKVKSTPDIYYKFDVNRHCNQTIHPNITYRMATCRQEDMSKISEYMISFFEPANEQQISDITDKKNLIEDIKV